MTLLDSILLIALFALGGVGALLYARYIAAQKALHLSETLRQEIATKAQALESTAKSLESSHIQALQEIASLKATLTTANERLQEQRADSARQKTELQDKYEQDLSKLESQYKLSISTLQNELAKNLELQKTALLNESKLALSKDSKAILDEVFTPIKTRVEEYQKTLLQNEAKLKENIDNAFKYSQEMSKSAQELGRILKGDKKLRGNFGELQLKRVFESSGLIEGRQYSLQEQLHTQGGRYIPDAIVRLDDKRNIIIDAKFPLPNAITCDDETEINTQEIAQNLKARIDELASKPYKDIENAYDFVLLFIPYNNILDLALEADSSLYNYAYSKQIYLTTPHTLFMALKTIAITWQHIQSDKNIKQAFEELGKFYDKFADVCSDFDKMARGLQSAQSAAVAMDTKLRGKGGLESRLDKLKDLGAKTKKSISKSKSARSAAIAMDFEVEEESQEEELED
ncbi:DNA recombination protein RmuC [uncultured Helicobacter sp.]|uniref:DNA recombination protein RmuC n=1 Tax=uncultured Helicobacter sp. TaxID=175537 RepID=UPI002614642E|nr:DNA recombination protein RmuC [uncultured Helicobacter sp.]